METTGRLKTVARDMETQKLSLTFEIDSLPNDLAELKGCDTLDVTAKKHRKHRSKNANALLWSCLGKIASTILSDKWSVYLEMLKRYGEFTYLLIDPQAVEMLRRQWRECEVIGEIEVDGVPKVEMLCYYGSSTYDSKQFTVLLEGVFSEMKEMGLESPPEEELRRSIEVWEKMRDRDT